MQTHEQLIEAARVIRHNMPLGSLVKIGYWNTRQEFIWVETHVGLNLWEMTYEPSTCLWNWQCTFVFRKDERTPTSGRFRQTLSNLYTLADVNTKIALQQLDAVAAIEELIRALEAGGFGLPRDVIDVKAQRKKDGICPECGHKGEWRMMALMCPLHGRFAG